MSRSSRRFVARKFLQAPSGVARTAVADGIPLADALFVVAVIVASLISVAVAAALWTGASVRTPAVLEVPLGSFRCASGTELVRRELQFEAIALVGGSEEHQLEKAEILSRHSARISQAVEEAGRVANSQELHEPGLNVFRGRIRTRINRALGAYLIEEVLVTDFQFRESNRLAQADKRLDWNNGI